MYYGIEYTANQNVGHPLYIHQYYNGNFQPCTALTVLRYVLLILAWYKPGTLTIAFSWYNTYKFRHDDLKKLLGILKLWV